MAGRKAVVVGGTGAIGRELVGQLLTSPQWGKVTTVGRRAVEVPAEYQGWDAAKLQQVVVNMDNLETEGAAAFSGADTVFCTLGTTRGVAGSAEAFRKVDLHYVERAAAAATEGGAYHFSLVTAGGANAKIWASDLAPFHPLLYAKTKGQAEEAVKAQSFPWLSIFRPGALARQEARTIEKVLTKALPSFSIAVADVARVMVLDAERYGAAQPAAAPGTHYIEMKALQRAAKEGVAPPLTNT